jgi:hypothetical protein
MASFLDQDAGLASDPGLSYPITTPMLKWRLPIRPHNGNQMM